MPLKPQQPAPAMEVMTLGDGPWRLSDARPATFSMIVAYRGLHCGVCKMYLTELSGKASEFERRGVDVIAVSSDSRERAEKARDEWQIGNLRTGYDLPLATARDWGLFVSSAIRDGEPAQFTEPGLFLVRPDGTLFFAATCNAPWGRPQLDQVLRGIDAAVERGTPARGEL